MSETQDRTEAEDVIYHSRPLAYMVARCLKSGDQARAALGGDSEIYRHDRVLLKQAHDEYLEALKIYDQSLDNGK